MSEKETANGRDPVSARGSDPDPGSESEKDPVIGSDDPVRVKLKERSAKSVNQ